MMRPRTHGTRSRSVVAMCAAVIQRGCGLVAMGLASLALVDWPLRQDLVLAALIGFAGGIGAMVLWADAGRDAGQGGTGDE